MDVELSTSIVSRGLPGTVLSVSLNGEATAMMRKSRESARSARNVLRRGRRDCSYSFCSRRFENFTSVWGTNQSRNSSTGNTRKSR